jgi:DNA-binding NarL/FixJ family response regulator
MTRTDTATGSAQSPVILVVDDSFETLKMLCEALHAEGFLPLAATNAQEALERFEMAVPDGVLLDAIMPGMDGFELCEQLKTTPPWSHVPVIFMTGLAETNHVLKGFACGGVDYVVKPLRIPEVIARLTTHVRNARVARLAREANDIAGLGSLVLDNQYRVAWQSPKAAEWLNTAFPQRSELEAWLREASQFGQAMAPLIPRKQLLARQMGHASLGETMLLLRVIDTQEDPAHWLRRVSLTPRETEVLSWLAKGKTNRDIADILGMSPRTVNKHLEHIFQKLGVETRSAAAVIAEKYWPSKP